MGSRAVGRDAHAPPNVELSAVLIPPALRDKLVNHGFRMTADFAGLGPTELSKGGARAPPPVHAALTAGVTLLAAAADMCARRGVVGERRGADLKAGRGRGAQGSAQRRQARAARRQVGPRASAGACAAAPPPAHAVHAIHARAPSGRASRCVARAKTAARGRLTPGGLCGLPVGDRAGTRRGQARHHLLLGHGQHAGRGCSGWRGDRVLRRPG